MCCSCLLLSYQYTHPILSPLSLCLQQLVHLFYFIFCLFSCLLLPFLFFPSSTSFTFCPLLFPVYLCCYSNIFTLVTDYQLIHPISLFKYPQSEKRQQSNISNLQVRKVYKPRSRFFFFSRPYLTLSHSKAYKLTHPFFFFFIPCGERKATQFKLELQLQLQLQTTNYNFTSPLSIRFHPYLIELIVY